MRDVDEGVLRRLADRAGLTAASIVLADVETSRRVRLDGERALAPASMIKLPIAFALEAQRARGRLQLADRLTVGSENLTANDAPSAFVPGYRATLGELGHAMLAASDNVATNVLIDVLGRESVDETCARLGAVHTHVRRKLSGALPLIEDAAATGRNAHPAADAARLFELLLEADAPQWIITALAAQVWNGKLTRGFRSTDRFVHKTGDTDDVSHDGGILTTAAGRRYIVVVYAGIPANPDSDARHRLFARLLRPFLAA